MSKRINQIEPLIDKKDHSIVNSYIKSGGWLTEHNETRKFEDNIKKYVNRKYAVAVPNGTIHVKRLQLPNKKPMSDKELLNGYIIDAKASFKNP